MGAESVWLLVGLAVLALFRLAVGIRRARATLLGIDRVLDARPDGERLDVPRTPSVGVLGGHRPRPVGGAVPGT
ncbi:MAG TPA: hypothetical protein VLO09_08955 [Ornithinimicrobium sp.]|nr:hypothetical protein [Ornithinimicrobium sp.]